MVLADHIGIADAAIDSNKGTSAKSNLAQDQAEIELSCATNSESLGRADDESACSKGVSNKMRVAKDHAKHAKSIGQNACIGGIA